MGSRGRGGPALVGTVRARCPEFACRAHTGTALSRMIERAQRSGFYPSPESSRGKGCWLQCAARGAPGELGLGPPTPPARPTGC